jgi:hypothetical protein
MRCRKTRPVVAASLVAHASSTASSAATHRKSRSFGTEIAYPLLHTVDASSEPLAHGSPSNLAAAPNLILSPAAALADQPPLGGQVPASLASPQGAKRV